MAKIGKIILGTVAVAAIGAGLVYGWQQWRESSVMNSSREAQVASDKEVTSGPATKLLWGDTHLHTSNSIDAFGFGVKLGPEEALHFARGEEVTSTWGLKAKLARPLDFLVIADHSGGLGATKALKEAPGFMIKDPTLKRWHDMMNESPEGQLRATGELINAAGSGGLAGKFPPEQQKKRTMGIWNSHSSTVL
jgi:hypothetical protein